MVSHIEIMVEGLSMEAALRLIVPKIAGSLSFEVYPYQCKQDLLDKLAQRLQGYPAWLPDDWRLMVLLDRDEAAGVHRLPKFPSPFRPIR